MEMEKITWFWASLEFEIACCISEETTSEYEAGATDKLCLLRLSYD